ncbi:hypothetical protein MMG00_09470 [Ignatzschineria rhizosphaerae]|uniref:CAF17 C-terminal domain-containing protein n=1 Tax=Ignatzschineria rhizosphaerae TaxID=2923279 RepID=A0ABY3WXW1_9GAMM|nr:hypothetical protein [Ignatzschineria rhizosphaerae]UNM95453.1 hypothetical protein MMG00_09470 [Ignatzschineria rhizosphaerae]
MSIKLSRLIVAGKDAAGFLQGQTTADVNKLSFIDQKAEQQYGLSAICNRQGRVISLFWMIKINDETFHLLLPESLADKVQKHLTIFIFRSKVTITRDEPSSEDIATLPTSLTIPWIIDENSEEYVPQMLSLDLLLAINFKKGCYTGQEIIARMQYLGKHKRRLARIHSENATELQVNAKILNEKEQDAGTIVYSEGNDALAVIRLESKDQALKIQSPIQITHIWHDDEPENE